MALGVPILKHFRVLHKNMHSSLDCNSSSESQMLGLALMSGQWHWQHN